MAEPTTRTSGQPITTANWNGSLTEGAYPILVASNKVAAKDDEESYTAIHTYNLSNTQANFDYLKVVFHGWGYVMDSSVGGTQTEYAYLSIFSSATQISGHEINTNEGLLHIAGSWGGGGNVNLTAEISGEIILTAGVDYDKGIAFALTIKGKVETKAQGGEVGVSRSSVWGFNSIV